MTQARVPEHRSLAALIGIAVLCAATASEAAMFKVRGQRGAHTEFSVFANYVEGDTQHYGADGIAAHDDDYGWGIGLHHNFDNHWNLGLDIAWNRPDYRALFLDPETGEPVRVDHSATRYDTHLNLQFNLLPGQVTPFIQGGIGWIYMDSNIVKDLKHYCGGFYYPYCYAYASTFNDSSFAYNVGAGLRVDLSDAVFIRASLMQQWVDTRGTVEPLNARVELGFKY